MAQERPTQGVQIIEESLGAPPISTANFSAIGIAGTAPDAKGKFLNKAKTGIAYNQPFFLTKRSDAADLGNEGTLPLALDSIFAQGSVGVVVIIVQDEKAPVFNLDDALYQTTWTGSNPAKVEFMITNSDKRIEFQSQNAHFDTDAANAVKALRRGQEITIDNNSGAGLGTAPVYRVTGTPGEEGTDANAVVYVPVEQTATTPTALTAGNSYKMDAPAQDGVAETQTNVIGNGSTFTGIWGFLAAGTEVGVTPRIIATPGIDNGTPGTGGTKNSLGAALETVAGKIRAIAIIDLPNAQSDVIGDAGAASKYSSDRTLLVSPAAKMAKPGSEAAVEFAMSGFIAGKIAVNDSEQGFWTPIGNKSLAGVLGLAVPVDFQMDNPNSGAQLRINAGTITVINFGGGFRTWGDATPASDDPAYRFVNVRRIGDILAYSIQVNHLWAVSKAMGKNYLSEVAENVNAYIRILKAQGALRGGFCYPDGEKNTPEAIANGQAYFNLEYTPVYPATSITFSVQLTNKYLAEGA